jgi:hypothetical protein
VTFHLENRDAAQLLIAEPLEQALPLLRDLGHHLRTGFIAEHLGELLGVDLASLSAAFLALDTADVIGHLVGGHRGEQLPEVRAVLERREANSQSLSDLMAGVATAAQQPGVSVVSMSWGFAFGSGGGISLYEPEPAYQAGVQSTGSRTTPDVSFVADPATGAWIADPYNLDPSYPFEIVGGTSLSAPAWAGLLAVANQGRVAAGETTLNSTGPTAVQQALYTLPQSDYRVITSGYNGYTTAAGYNLVTGLGTPIAGELVPDLVAYAGSGNFASTGLVPAAGAAQLVNTLDPGGNGSGPINAINVFNVELAATDGRARTVDASFAAATHTAVQAARGQAPWGDLVTAMHQPATGGSTSCSVPTASGAEQSGELCSRWRHGITRRRP